jgi:hypothetical protein
MFDGPAHFLGSDRCIALMKELLSECGVGRGANDVLGLMDIDQWVCVRTRRRRTRGPSGGSRCLIADFSGGSMCLRSKRAELGRALATAGKFPDPLKCLTGP